MIKKQQLGVKVKLIDNNPSRICKTKYKKKEKKTKILDTILYL